MSELKLQKEMAAELVPPQQLTIPVWVQLVVIAGALMTAAGAIIALVHPIMLVSPHDQINGAVRIYAGYLVSRNLAMAGLLIVLLILRAQRALRHLMVLVGLIQLLDACMDYAEDRWAIMPGVLVFGLIFLLAARRLGGAIPFWSREAWIG